MDSFVGRFLILVAFHFVLFFFFFFSLVSKNVTFLGECTLS